VEANAGGRLQLEIAPSEVRGLLRASAGVIEEQQERVVAPRVPARRGQGREERVNVIALEKARFRRGRPFHRDRGDALGHGQELRDAAAQVLEERVQARQALIPRAHAVTPGRLQVVQKAERAFETQVVEGQLGDLPARVLRDEAQEEAKSVSIAAEGGRAEALHRHEPVEEEGLQMRPDGRAHVAVSRRPEAANASKR
jgi:hypothetical protein